MSFRFNLEVGNEIMTTVNFLDTVDDIAAEEFVRLASVSHLLSFECRTVHWQSVNYLVQLVRVLI